MAKALKCDRCGKFYELNTDETFAELSLRRYSVDRIGVPHTEESGNCDLCPDCVMMLTSFVFDYKTSQEGETIATLRNLDDSTILVIDGCDQIYEEFTFPSNLPKKEQALIAICVYLGFKPSEILNIDYYKQEKENA